ncbi:sugar porter family MFS transporter [Dongshaea marina]|uniref:sugar porter family MFS transporter n=1 Tax=Dongshaea marina TaxID=2047966 RepID=UPI0018FFC13F|nr:sugar porter family MFS transporter [Dongshaea marina]
MVSPMYIAEVAPSERRGALVSCNQLAIIFGMLLIYFVNYAIASLGDRHWLDTLGWRYMFASGVVPSLLFLGLLFTVPETPRWLALRGREREARELLMALDPDSNIEQQWQEIHETTQQRSIKLLGSGLGYVIFVGIMLSVFQQVTGINVFLYYAPRILSGFNHSGLDIALLETILVGAVNLLFTLIAIYTVDRFGRRPLMMGGALVMGLCMLAIGTAAYLNLIGGYLLIFMLGYIAAFALSLGPVTWVLLSEMFPNRVRAKALSIAVFAQWLANFLVSQTFPMMTADNNWLQQTFHGGAPFWLYGIMGLVTVGFVAKCVPETKNRSLEELEALWERTEKSPQLSPSGA